MQDYAGPSTDRSNSMFSPGRVASDLLTHLRLRNSLNPEVAGTHCRTCGKQFLNSLAALNRIFLGCCDRLHRKGLQMHMIIYYQSIFLLVPIHVISSYDKLCMRRWKGRPSTNIVYVAKEMWQAASLQGALKL